MTSIVQATDAIGFQRVRTVQAPFETVVDSLKRAIEQENLWVLHEIDPQALLKRGGFEIKAARQILFFHPRYMARLLAAQPAAALEAPLKFAVLTDASDVVVRWYDPVAAFSRYGHPELSRLADELSILCERIVATALGGHP